MSGKIQERLAKRLANRNIERLAFLDRNAIRKGWVEPTELTSIDQVILANLCWQGAGVENRRRS